MIQKDIWGKYILAQSKILDFRSNPIEILAHKDIDGLKLKLSVDQDEFKSTLKEKIENVFKIKDFDFSSGFINKNIEDGIDISEEQLLELKTLSEKYYFNFNENPVIDGVIEGNSEDAKFQLEKIIGKIPNDHNFLSSGQIFLAIDNWKKVNEIEGITINKKGAAIFTIMPSVSYLISTFYKNIEISQAKSTI